MSTAEKPKLLVSTGPFDNIVILGHSTIEERDLESGKVGSTLEDADVSDIYRSTLPEIHDKALGPVKELSGMEREVNATQTAKNQARADAVATKKGVASTPVKSVYETPVNYFNRVKAAVSDEIWKEIDAKFREIALATPVDASPSKRQGAPSKANMEKAAEILTRADDAIDATVEKLKTNAPNYDLELDADGKPEQKSLARLVGIYLDVEQAKQKGTI